MVNGSFIPMTIGTILWDAQHTVDNGIFNHLPDTGMTENTLAIAIKRIIG